MWSSFIHCPAPSRNKCLRSNHYPRFKNTPASNLKSYIRARITEVEVVPRWGSGQGNEQSPRFQAQHLILTSCPLRQKPKPLLWKPWALTLSYDLQIFTEWPLMRLMMKTLKKMDGGEPVSHMWPLLLARFQRQVRNRTKEWEEINQMLRDQSQGSEGLAHRGIFYDNTTSNK